MELVLSGIKALIFGLHVATWVVVKIMVSLWVLNIIPHLLFRGPKRDDNLDNHPCAYGSGIPIFWQNSTWCVLPGGSARRPLPGEDVDGDGDTEVERRAGWDVPGPFFKEE